MNWPYLLSGQSSDVSRLDVYRRIVSHDPGDGLTRAHRQTQTGVPRKARLLVIRARRYLATVRQVEHDERFTERVG